MIRGCRPRGLMTRMVRRIGPTGALSRTGAGAALDGAARFCGPGSCLDRPCAMMPGPARVVPADWGSALPPRGILKQVPDLIPSRARPQLPNVVLVPHGPHHRFESPEV